MNIQELRNKQGFIADMDGVIYHGNRLIPGAEELVAWFERSGKKYIFLTNNSQRSPRELSQKLDRLGIRVEEKHFYTYDRICHAVSLVNNGSRLIGTNPDTTGPVESGIVPATGALMAPIEMATAAKAYYVGKPNPIMMQSALKMVECRREDTIIIGDRMDTDIIAGVEAGMETVLVLTGITTLENMRQFAYRPSLVLQSIAEIPG